MKTFFTLLSLMIFTSLWAQKSKNIYVSPSGNDAGPGSFEQPFRSLQKAADVAKPGDTVHLRAGIHNYNPDPKSSSVVLLNRDGEKGKPITFTNYFDPVTKTYEDAVIQTFVENPANAQVAYSRLYRQAFTVLAKWINLEHLAIRGSRSTISLEEARRYERMLSKDPDFPDDVKRRMFQSGIRIECKNGKVAGHIKVDHCIIQECTTTAIGVNTGDQKDFSPMDILITNNIIRENNQRNNWGSSAVNLFLARNKGDKSTQVTIENNDIYNNENMLIWARAKKGADGKDTLDANGKPVLQDHNGGWSDGSGIIVDHSFEFTGRVLIKNNLVRNNGAAGICITGAPHIDIVNNTIYRNANNPHLKWANITLVQKQTRDVIIKDNISWSRNGQPAFFGKTDGVDEISFSGNVHYNDKGAKLEGTKPWNTLPSGDQFADPLFVDAPGGDFRLRPGSPAQGKGANLAKFDLPVIPASLRLP